MSAAQDRRSYLNDIPLGKGRIQSLSDGVFAVSMGVMILQLAIPVVPAGAPLRELLWRLGAMAPALLACAGGFVLMAVLWYYQHVTFHFVRHTNGVLLWLNLVFLMFLAGLPFSISMLGRYPMEATAQFLFFGNLLAASTTLNWHWYYAIRHYMVAPEMEVEIGRRITGQLRLAPAACVLALALALLSPNLAYIGFALVLLLGLILERFRKSAPGPVLRRTTTSE